MKYTYFLFDYFIIIIYTFSYCFNFVSDIINICYAS
jgi:hypothetical protein